MLNRLRAAIVLLYLLPSAGTSQDYDAALRAYNAGDYEAALREWRPLAAQGDA